MQGNEEEGGGLWKDSDIKQVGRRQIIERTPPPKFERRIMHVWLISMRWCVNKHWGIIHAAAIDGDGCPRIFNRRQDARQYIKRNRSNVRGCIRYVPTKYNLVLSKDSPCTP